jgi:agmatine deiminase
VTLTRRRFLHGTIGLGGALIASTRRVGAAPAKRPATLKPRWFMPAEDLRHERTWMCWPSSKAVWGSDLTAVQDTIIEIASSIATFEPVSMLARPSEVRPLRKLIKGIDVIEAPVDDLWARDTLPNFLIRKGADSSFELGAGHARFNGWGGKQISSGDSQLASLVCKRVGVELVDCGLVGEGGGVEVDGTGTVLAAASCWVNANRNPGRTRAEVQSALLTMLGAQRMIWVDGLAGHDITDGHIDTLARFVNPTTILVDKPAFNDSTDPWVAVASRTRQQVERARTVTGTKYNVVEIVQPKSFRGSGSDFLSTYMNYYVCNDAVIAPEFGDKTADRAARQVLQGLFPDREVVQLNIDALAAGGGGIHCATQQEPSTTATTARR